mgnify:CR=1 FL=1
MRAMVYDGGEALSARELPDPAPSPGQVRIRVKACGVCRTDLHLIDGELRDPKIPVIPGHQIVGIVDAVGASVTKLSPGDRVGVPWLGWTCGECDYCQRGEENLCDGAKFHGYTLDGGYAEYAIADPRYCFPLPGEEAFPDLQVAPLLCAGLIGFRSLRMCGEDARRIGFYGFGAAAHILVQVVRHRGGDVYAFVRPGDDAAAEFALRRGCIWAGGSDADPPQPLDAAIIFAPAGELVPAALRAVHKGGVVVCGGIHMSDIPSFPYRWLWEERTIRSVANLTRRDGDQFLTLAAQIPVRTTVRVFPLEGANDALATLKAGDIEGAAVLCVD